MRIPYSRPLLAVAICLLAVPAFAQPGGRGGRGGFGGPGGPGGFGRGGGSLVQLLMIPQVREELDLEERQEEAIQELGRRPDGDRPRFDRNASEEEQREFIAQRQQEARERDEKLDEILLPPQVKRLKEIRLQMQGPRALLDDEVAEKLELTSEQRAKVREASESSAQKMRELFQEGGFRQEGFREKVAELAEESNEKMVGVLTEDQKETWDELKGEPFEFERRRGGFGGRRGGGGGDDNGDRPRRRRGQR